VFIELIALERELTTVNSVPVRLELLLAIPNTVGNELGTEDPESGVGVL